MPELKIELSIEQQFQLRLMDAMIEQMSIEELREAMKELLYQMAIKDTVVRQLMKRL